MVVTWVRSLAVEMETKRSFLILGSIGGEYRK